MKTTKVPVRHITRRTCLGCREVKAKREVIRLVRLEDGSVCVDKTGKKSGRGAYLCPKPSCWEEGLRGSRLEHALKTALTPDNKEQLIEFGKSLGRSM